MTFDFSSIGECILKTSKLTWRERQGMWDGINDKFVNSGFRDFIDDELIFYIIHKDFEMKYKNCWFINDYTKKQFHVYDPYLDTKNIKYDEITNEKYLVSSHSGFIPIANPFDLIKMKKITEKWGAFENEFNKSGLRLVFEGKTVFYHDYIYFVVQEGEEHRRGHFKRCFRLDE